MNMAIKRQILLAVLIAMACQTAGLAAEPAKPSTVPVVESTVTLLDRAARDQDDMCVWVHPSDRAKSVVVTSDKAAHKIFVYDLEGNSLQSIDVPLTGNIDVRYGFPLAGKRVDIVACNEREPGFKILVFAVDPKTRKLERVDNGKINTGENYGGALVHSHKSRKFYFLTAGKSAGSEQYELVDDGQGHIEGTKVRSLKAIGLSEGVVADDELGRLYISEEQKGVWEADAEPDSPIPPKLVLKVGEHGLVADVEGLALYHRPKGQGYIVVSAQGASRYNVYQRSGQHAFVGTFTIHGARETDGIEVVATPLGPRFPHGLFACHTDPLPCRVLLTPWQAIAAALGPDVDASSQWDPREPAP